MPDYDLTGLSPRSFEQLIQAIALQEVSPKAVVFGDGTDGGREATFQGKTNYNSGDESWDGYVVFQAKFCQRPTNDTKKDGNWAIGQLKKELEDFANSEKRRKKPEYYIFITNVVLTPVLEKGSKDKAYKVFEEYQDTVPVKDFDIWDYDKICRFIDANADIRRTYAAWITPGDVLSQVIEMLSFNKADFKTVISSFLKKELQSELYANLEQAGHSTEDKIPLASVFVDLPVTGRQIKNTTITGEDSYIVASIVENARHKLDYDSLFSGRDYNTSVHGFVDFKHIQKSGKWVVIGGPGQGKTTVGQFLCQLFRAAILKDVDNLRDREVEQALSKFQSQCEEENICFPKARRFPLRIVLNEFAAVLASNDSIDSVLDYIAWYIQKRTSRNIDVEDIRQWLANYPWLIVLDGLDEVPASSNRQQVMTAISDFGIDANELNADIMVVATTRPQGYNDDFNTDFYDHVWLAPLSREQALHYARRLLGIRYENDSDRQSKIITRLERAANDNFTSRLMQSPLQVTIMTVLLNKAGQAPKDRWSLFNKYYDIIYDREVERDIPASEILRDYKSDIDSIHFQVGLLLQVQSEHSGKTDARLSVEDFTTLVRSRLEAEGHEGKECEALTKQIIEAAANRLVFLVGLEQDVVGFEVRSLQEFMASEAIMNGSDEQIRDRLKEIIPIISWRNVVLFAIGKCFARNEKEHLRSFIHTECAALNDLDEFNSACISGSRLALDILEDGSVTHKPKFLKLFTRLALRLLDLSSDILHIRLANIFSDNLEAIYKEEIHKRINNSNYHQSFGTWTTLFQLINLGEDWAIDIGGQYWFEEVDRQLSLLSCYLQLDFIVIDKEKWIAEKINQVVIKKSPIEIWESIPIYQGKLFDFNISNDVNEILSAIELRSSDGSDGFLEPVYFDCNYPLFANNLIDNDIVSLFFIHSNISSSEASVKEIMLFDEDFLERLQNISEINHYWIAYKYSVDFWRYPSKELLAKALKYIANHYDQELINWIADIVPWQISECLLATQSSQELLKISELAKNGRLGSKKDWFEAEERWDNLRITKEDFLYKQDSKELFDCTISKKGFPFATNPFVIYHRNRKSEEYLTKRKEILNILISLYSLTSSEDILRVISSLIFYLIVDFDNTVVEEFIDEYLYHSYNIVKQALYKKVELEKRSIVQNILQRIITIYKINEDVDLLKLIDDVGQNEEFYDYLAVDNPEQLCFFKDILKSYQHNPELIGLLNIISSFYPSNEVLELFSTIDLELIDPDLFTEDKYKEAAIIINFSRQDWLDNNLNNVIDYAINTIDDKPLYPRFIHILVLLLESKYYEIPLIEKCLIQLINKLPKSRWTYLSRINKLVYERITAKTSNLSKTSEWSKLGLPSGASLLLPE